jgi:hypothetical protein
MTMRKTRGKKNKKKIREKIDARILGRGNEEGSGIEGVDRLGAEEDEGG